MEPGYSRDVVQPVVVDKVGGNALSLQYTMPGETLFYSPGVDYQSDGNTLQVVILRCSIQDKDNDGCAAMAKVPLPLKQGWQVKVELPYDGQNVVMVYTDKEEPIYP